MIMEKGKINFSYLTFPFEKKDDNKLNESFESCENIGNFVNYAD
jgi:hypothetical protein